MDWKKLMVSAIIASSSAMTPSIASTATKNIVLVHGAVMDGSTWQAVYTLLKSKDYNVSVVQLPLKSLADDIRVTQQVVEQQSGPVVLVAHSYGGAVISHVGSHAKVKALVYVAALQPDIGETVAELNSRFPLEAHVVAADDGTIIVDPEHFHDDVAADVSKEQASFLADSQKPTAISLFTTSATEAAWNKKPTFAVIATEDRTVSPQLQRYMYQRAGAKITELDASHLVHVSQAEHVAEVIVEASRK